jgi:hypothetical protein
MQRSSEIKAVVDKDQEYPSYASYVTPEAKARRDKINPDLRLKIMEITELLSMNPTAFENRTQKLPVGGKVYLYEHPNPPLQITYQLLEDTEPRIIKFVHFAALKMEVKRTLFISYSHKDLKWLLELRKFLKGLESQDIALWDDRQIKASARWKDEIDKALIAAKAALLLISQDFLDSDFISQKELPFLLKKAEKEGLRIFWIPVRPSTVKNTSIAEFQAAVDDPSISIAKLGKVEREELLVRIYEKIAEAVSL